MPRTINLKQVLVTDLVEVGMVGGNPNYEVVFTARRGTGAESIEIVKLVVPLDEFLNINETVVDRINRIISKAAYLKELIA